MKNIIFDIGDVLASPITGYWLITPNFYNIIDKNKLDLNKLEQSLLTNYPSLTQEPKTEEQEFILFSKYYYKSLKDINYPVTKEIADAISYDCVYNDSKVKFYSDVVSTLEYLKDKYELYIISDAWPSINRILKHNDLTKYFKDIIVSSMYSTIKKDNLFKVFTDLHPNLNPKESIFIDDNIDNLKEASKYNFNTILMNRKNNLNNNEYNTIHNLNELIKYL